LSHTPAAERTAAGQSTAWLELLGGEVHFHNAGGVRTRCLEAGAGEPLLLLHGRGAHAEKWLKNVLPLGTSFRVHAIDLLGHGCTALSPSGGYSIADFADHSERVLDAAGIQATHIVGHTLGGWIGTWLAYRSPSRVRTITTILCAGLPSAGERAERPEQPGSLFQSTLDDDSLQMMRKRMLRLFHDPSVLTDELVAIRTALYRRPGVLEALRQMAATGNGAYVLTDDVLQSVAQPALLLGSEHAHSTTPAMLERAARLMPRAQLHTIQGSGQWPQFESPAEVNQVVTEFLTRF
jgi:pimeloyl-ACP methyl ester carboxylesterase